MKKAERKNSVKLGELEVEVTPPVAELEIVSTNTAQVAVSVVWLHTSEMFDI
jgi:hypothetical protein